MGINRRNILIGLGAVVGGGGALVSTGAFTTVSAERSVEVSTAGDASAFLTLEGDGQYVTDVSGDGTLTIDLAGPDSNGFNQEAVTTLDGVVTITNNAADDSSAKIGVSTEGADDAQAGGSATLMVGEEDATADAEVTFYVNTTDGYDDTGDPVNIDEGNSAELDVKIDTRADTIDGATSDTDGLTIVATED